MGERHIRVVRGLGHSLVGVCDVRPEALQQAEIGSGVPRTALFRDAEEMLRSTRPECVVVATTTPSHTQLTLLAVAMGARAILCEKPMATSLADCDRMIEECERHKVTLAVNHQMRFMEQYREPKRLLDLPDLGGVTSVSVVAGNFGLAMNGTHYFEMFRYITGEEPSRVTAWLTPIQSTRGAAFDDCAGAVRVETESGKRLYIETGADQGHGVTVVYCGRYGQIVVDELTGVIRVVAREAAMRDRPTWQYGCAAVAEELRVVPADSTAPTRQVLSALLRGEDVPDGRIGRMAVATLVAAYVSHDEGHRPVALADTADFRERSFRWA